MTQELRERVARVLAEFQGEIHEGTWKFYLKDADAAIALVLEEAARLTDRIERLEAALREIASYKADEDEMDWADTVLAMNAIARAALEEKQ